MAKSNPEKASKKAKSARKPAKKAVAQHRARLQSNPGLYPPEGTLTQKAEERLLRALAAQVQASWKRACGELLTIGQLVVDSCYAGDAAAAIEDGAERNGRFMALARRVEALGIGLSAARLSVAKRLVGWNHRIKSPYWDQLDVGHKEVLLVTKDQRLMTDGAQWALQMSASTRRLKKWVDEHRGTADSAPTARGVRWNSTQRGLETLVRAASQKSLARIAADVGKLTPEERNAARKTLVEVRAVLPKLEALLGKG